MLGNLAVIHMFACGQGSVLIIFCENIHGLCIDTYHHASGSVHIFVLFLICDCMSMVI